VPEECLRTSRTGPCYVRLADEAQQPGPEADDDDDIAMIYLLTRLDLGAISVAQQRRVKLRLALFSSHVAEQVGSR